MENAPVLADSRRSRPPGRDLVLTQRDSCCATGRPLGPPAVAVSRPLAALLPRGGPLRGNLHVYDNKSFEPEEEARHRHDCRNRPGGPGGLGGGFRYLNSNGADPLLLNEAWNSFGIADLQFTANIVPGGARVPEPGTLALLGLGVLAFAASRRGGKTAKA